MVTPLTLKMVRKFPMMANIIEKDILVVQEYFHIMQSLTVTIILLSAALTIVTTDGTWLLQNISADKNIEDYTSVKKLQRTLIMEM